MPMSIETKRLILKDYTKNDLDNVYKLKSDQLVWKFSSKTATNDIEESRSYLIGVLKSYEEDKCNFQALYIKATGEYIGEAGVLSFNRRNQRGVIGYNLLSKYWGNGYATEITIGLVKYLFKDANVQRIEALVMEGNRASRKVLEKSGFILEGLLRNFTYIDNKYFNVYYYGMIRSDFYD